MLRRASWILISLLVVLGMVVVACGPQATPEPTEPPAEEPTEPPAEEPTEVPEEEAGIDCMGAQPGDEITLL